MADHVCADCDHPPFKNAGALRFHRIAKHGAAAGTCGWCGQPFKNLPAHQGKCKQRPAVGATEVDPGPDSGMDAGPGFADYAPTAEQAPNVGPTTAGPSTNGKTKLRDKLKGGRLWGAGDKDSPGTSAPAGGLYEETGTKEKAPRTKTAGRKSTAPILGLLWGGVGTLLVRSRADIPVGRTLQFQSDVAGDVLDKLFARSLVDRLVLQPLAGKEEEVEQLGALIAAPILVGLAERNPEAGVFYEPLLRQVVAANLVGMAPAIKRRKDDEKKLRAVTAELFPDLPPDADHVGAVLDSIFAAPPPSPGPHLVPDAPSA